MSEIKILDVGDFHGRFPNKLLKIAKRKDIDLIVSPGDFAGDNELNKLYFKYVYGTNKPLSDFIGKKKAKKIEDRSFNTGSKVLKTLDSLGKPVIIATGNWDYSKWFDIGSKIKLNKDEKAYIKKFYCVLNSCENVILIDFSTKKEKGVEFAGYPRSSYPGFVSKRYRRSLIKKHGRKARRYVKSMNNDNKRYYSKLSKLIGKNTVFITHNAPYMTRLDKIKQGPMNGEHYGSWLAKRIIIDRKPFLAICGHMHEDQGIIRIGRTVVVNGGAAYEGKGSIISIDTETKKVKSVKLIR